MRFFKLSTFLLCAIPAFSSGANLVVNGDFEAGNVGFETQYTYSPTCGGVGGEGIYTVDNRNCYGPGIGGPSGAGQLFFANGAVNTTQYVWRQQLATNSGARYYFSAQAASGVGANPPVLNIQTAPLACAAASDGDFTTIGSITATTTVWQWVASNGIFPATSADTCLRLLNNNNAASGNDYGLDNIFVDILHSVTASVGVGAAGTVVCTATQPVAGALTNEVLNGGDATCTVTPNPGFTFTNWTGSCTGNNPVCNLTGVAANQVSVANFLPAAPPGSVNGIPTLSEWGLIVLSLLLALVASARGIKRP